MATMGFIQMPDPQKIQKFEYRMNPQHEWRMFPKPQSIKKTHNKVIVVFDRKEWERVQFIHRKRVMDKLPPDMRWRHK